MQVLETPTTNVVSFSPLLRRYTLEEFWDLPEPEDRAHYELIGGWLFMSLPPDWPHGDFDARLKKSLILFLAGQGDPGNVYHPREAIHTDDTYLHLGVRESEIPLLKKPFTPEALAFKVREVLDRII